MFKQNGGVWYAWEWERNWGLLFAMRPTSSVDTVKYLSVQLWSVIVSSGIIPCSSILDSLLIIKNCFEGNVHTCCI